MQTIRAANAQAARGHTAAVARALKRLGMQRCSENLVRRQWEENASQPSWYCLFWRWARAIWLVDRSRFWLLIADVCARAIALDATEQHPRPERGWFEQVAVCAREHGEGLAVATEQRDPAAIRRELAESIAAQLQLLAMLDRGAEVGGAAWQFLDFDSARPGWGIEGGARRAGAGGVKPSAPS
jgi:hypothetical protein